MKNKVTTINLQEWDRYSHFQHFRKMDHPHYHVCTPVEITPLLDFSRKHQLSFYGLAVHTISAAVNAVPQLRQRIQGEKVVEYQSTHPSLTVLRADNIFNFCLVEFQEAWRPFLQDFADKTAQAKAYIQLQLGDDHRDDLIYMSCLPWFSFNSISHPMSHDPMDAIPRVAWGKYINDGRKNCMPVSIQVNHALVDGYHLGQFYERLEELIIKFT